MVEIIDDDNDFCKEVFEGNKQECWKGKVR